MSDQRLLEDYRNYTLLAAFDKGSHKGRIWGPDKKLMGEVAGSDLKEIMAGLKLQVDALIAEKEGAGPPGVAEYVLAFQKILPALPDSYLNMLKAHYHAPDRTVTLGQLAEAGCFSNYNAAVLHYGKLGGRLHEQLPIKLPLHKDGSLKFTHMLADGGVGEDEHRQWKMRAEVAAAMEQLGLCD